MVIVCSGTLSFPLILQRSGLVIRRNFARLHLTISLSRAKPHTELFDDFLRGDPEAQKNVFNEWNIMCSGTLATNGIEAGVKARPTEGELKEMEKWPTPEFGSGWNSYFKINQTNPSCTIH